MRPTFPDATALLQAMRSGERTAEDIVSEHLDRIDREHDRINAAVKVFREEALAEARSPRPGPLSGVPLSIKETFAIEGQATTAGSLRMPPIHHDEDAEVVKRVRAAGAIVVAQSNVPEMAMAGETDNLRFGQTNNPLDESRTCGGSSGGEAALLAAGCSALGLGSDVLGSLRIPGAFCGVIGFKPASDAVDKWGTWPVIDGYMDSWLAVGPMARSVRDIRLLYNVIADKPLQDLCPVKGRRLIIPTPFARNTDVQCIEDALQRGQVALQAAGMKVEKHPFPEVEQYFLNLQRLVAHDFEHDLHRQLVTADGRILSLSFELFRQLIGRPTIYSGLFQFLMACVVVRPRDKKRVQQIIADFEAGRARYHEMLRGDGVLILPTVGMLAPEHGKMNRQSLKPGTNLAVTTVTFCNAMDLPAITIPAWSDVDDDTGLPPGIMLASAPGSEAVLLDTAHVLEQALAGQQLQA